MSDREVPTFYGHVDLDLWDNPASIVRYLRDASYCYPAADPDQRNVLRRLADQIEARLPSRIPEPGLWAVVQTLDGFHVNVGCGWQSVDTGMVHVWERLREPALHREGVES